MLINPENKIFLSKTPKTEAHSFHVATTIELCCGKVCV